MTDIERDQQLVADFECFRDECIRLRNTFNTYSALYESGEVTRALLAKVATLFFQDLSEWLIHSIILQVGRLTDPAESGQKKNLTVAYFADAMKDQQKSSFEMEALVVGISEYRDKIEPARSKMIAHADLATYQLRLTHGAHSEEDLNTFFESMQAFTDVVGNAIGVGPLDYRTQPGSGDVADLISMLKRTVQLHGKGDSDGRR